MLKVDHVTYVVRNLEEAMHSFETILHYIPWRQGIVDHAPQTRLVVLAAGEGLRIELIEPNPAVDSMFSRFLKERGEGIFGLSVFADDFDGQVKGLKSRGVPVGVATQDFLFPEYPFRMGWVPAERGHGVAIEFVDFPALPPFEKDWATQG